MKTKPLTGLENDVLLSMKKDYLKDFPKPKRKKDKQSLYRRWKKLPHDFKEELIEIYGMYNFSLIELIVVSFCSLLTSIVENEEVDKDSRLYFERRLKKIRNLSQ